MRPAARASRSSHLFSPCADEQARELGLDRGGSLDLQQRRLRQDLCETVLNGTVTLDQIEAMLLETAVDKARGNLSAAARMLGLTRPQLAYRLKRLQEESEAGVATDAQASSALRGPT